MRMEKNRFICLIFILFFFTMPVFSQILSPVSGKWSNRQLLVIDVPAGSTAFYSINGESPEKSGFAYDGPVLIDLDGEVVVNVSITDKNGNSELRKISYTVTDDKLPLDSDSAEFIKQIKKAGIVDYSAGNKFVIPKMLEYSLGENSKVFTPGTELSLSSSMIISRYIPCVVTDGNGKWRFIIKVSPVMSGLFSRKDVPFEIIDWDTFVFTDRNFIYKIDDQWWQQPKEKIILDRSVSHMISWQNVDYAKENITRYYVVAPKPSIVKKVEQSGEVLVTLEGQSGYKFGLIDDYHEASELYDSLNIDTFAGDNYDGKLKVGIFFDSVCQGYMDIDFSIHKRNPQAPLIMPSVDGEFSRNSVRIGIASPEKKDVYYAVSGPIILDENYTVRAKDILFDLNSVTYKKNYNAAVVLDPVYEGAAAYKVSAYCLDEHKNKSKLSEYSVIIDQKNYFVDGTVTDPVKIACANGTIDFPFTNFAQVLNLINQSRFVHIRVVGEVHVPAGTSVIGSNCQIEGVNDARLILAPTTTFVVRNSSVSFSNCIITLAESRNTTETASIFNLERGVLYLDGVELSAVFGKSGSIINSDNSVISIQNTGITSSAESYTSAIASVQSRIAIKKSRITSVAGTAVNVSAQGGIFELNDSTCIVTGVMGRIAELFDTHSTIKGNNFVGDLKKNHGTNKPVYTDEKNYSVEYTGNNITGF